MIVADRSPLLGAGIRIGPIQSQSSGSNPAQQLEEPESAALSDVERTSLLELVQASKEMPDRAKKRIMNRLNQDRVPQEIVDRLRSQAGS